MVCAINKIDSNISGLSFAEEVCLKQLPTIGVDGFDPTWYGLEPNSYQDFGGDIKTEARAPIEASRQNRKGNVVDLDANGGFNTDFTQSNLTRLLQGFFFADIREKPTTAPMNTAINDVTSVTAADDKYNMAATAAAFNVPGLLVKASNFAIAANNGLKKVVTADTNDITVGDGLSNEAAPPANAKIEAVGYEFAATDASIVVTGSVASLTSTAAVFNSLGLLVGEWIFIGGDTLATNRFANNVGYARIASIAAGALVFDDITFAAVNEVSTGKTIQIFFGSVIRNEPEVADIVRRSYNLERTLGEGATDTQAEYLEGAVCNELTLNIPEAKKINADLSFMACDHTQRSGEASDEIKDGTRIASLGEDAFNSTSNVYRLKMAIIDPADSTPSPLFGFVTEATININNNVSPTKAIGTLGAFDTTIGNFVVGGSLTAYFSTVEAVRAVRNNADVGFSAIFSAENAGFIFDIPLLGLGGGRLNVEKDKAIMVPLEPQAARCPNGYTLLYNVFPYLPDIAIAD